jgi:hypothetical protein
VLSGGLLVRRSEVRRATMVSALKDTAVTSPSMGQINPSQ